MNSKIQRQGSSIGCFRGLSIFIFIMFLSTNSVMAEPFVGGYLHLTTTFSLDDDIVVREAKIIWEIERAKEHGIRILMPFTATGGRALYPSDVNPDHYYGDWDPLAFLIMEARNRGLEVYPSVPVLASGGDTPRGILKIHPEWAVRDSDKNPLGYISPGHPDARDFVVRTLQELVDRYQLKGLLLDYLRYPNKPDSHLDATSEKQFLGQAEVETLDVSDRGDTPWQKFRETQLTTLMEEIRGGLPGIKLALYCWGPHVTRGHNVGQNWAAWARDGYLDIVNVSGYCYTDNYGDRFMDAFRDRLTGSKALLDQGGNRAEATFCLGVVTSHGRVKEAEQMKHYLDVASESGMEGVAIFTTNTLDEFHDEVVAEDYFREFVIAVEKGFIVPRN
jgi:hypothetical protein